MIHSNQVRIGNYLLNTYSEGEIIIKVTSINDHQIGCNIEGVKVHLSYKFENYKPIPLTGEMLAIFPDVQSLKIEGIGNGVFFHTATGQTVELKYLHQLQNLYFTITGEEFPLTFEIINAATKLIPAAA